MLKRKNVFSGAIIIPACMAMVLSGCGNSSSGEASSEVSSDSVCVSSQLTEEGQKLLDEFPDDKYVKAYNQIEPLFSSMSRNDKKDCKEKLEQIESIVSSVSSDDFYFDRGINVLSNTDDNKVTDEMCEVIDNHIRWDVEENFLDHAYADNCYTYDQPLKIDVNDYTQYLSQLGLQEKDKPSIEYTTHYFFDEANYPQDDDSNYSLNATVSFRTDPKNNVMGVASKVLLSPQIDNASAVYNEESDQRAQDYANWSYSNLSNASQIRQEMDTPLLTYLLSSKELDELTYAISQLSEDEIKEMYLCVPGTPSENNDESAESDSNSKESTGTFSYFVLVDDHIVTVNFALGQVNVGAIDSKEFYKATPFPNLVLFGSDKTGIHSDKTWDSLQDYCDGLGQFFCYDGDFSNMNITSSSEETTSESATADTESAPAEATEQPDPEWYKTYTNFSNNETGVTLEVIWYDDGYFDLAFDGGTACSSDGQYSVEGNDMVYQLTDGGTLDYSLTDHTVQISGNDYAGEYSPM